MWREIVYKSSKDNKKRVALNMKFPNYYAWFLFFCYFCTGNNQNS